MEQIPSLMKNEPLNHDHFELLLIWTYLQVYALVHSILQNWSLMLVYSNPVTLHWQHQSIILKIVRLLTIFQVKLQEH